MDSGLAMMGLALWQHLIVPVVDHRNMWLSTTTTRAMTTGAEIFVSRSRVAGLLMMRLLTMWSSSSRGPAKLVLFAEREAKKEVY